MSAQPLHVNQAALVRAAAAEYLAAGFALVQIPLGTKGPRTAGWNRREKAIRRLEDLPPNAVGIGLCHAWSGTWALDVDNWQKASAYLTNWGVDLQGLWDAPEAVRIISGRQGRGKLLYRLPDGVQPFRTVNQSEQHGLEFRCADGGGQTVQDVMPPSIHPDTGSAYLLELGMAASLDALPEAPAVLMELIGAVRSAEPAAANSLATVTAEDAARQLEELRGALQFIPSDDRDTWQRVGHALKPHGEAGRAIWLEWSATSPKHQPEADSRTWDTFRPTSTGPAAVFKLAQAQGWVNPKSREAIEAAATADEFEDLSQAAKRPNPYSIQWGVTVDLAAALQSRYFIKGVLDRAELGIIFGAPGAGKSFLVLDMALAIARGVPWREHRVQQARVVYFTLEGNAGFPRRLAAYQEHHGIDLSALPFAQVGTGLDLRNKVNVENLIDAIEAAGGAELLVLDTFARATPGANENASEDMGLALRNAAEIHQATGAMVLLVHHSGKDQAKGGRGWSGLKAAADVELEVLRDGDYRAVKLTKVKDGKDGDEIAFSLQIVPLGVDQDGDAASSMVLSSRGAGQRSRQPKGARQKQALRILQGLFEMDDQPVALNALIAAVVQDIPHDTGTTKRDTRRGTVMEAIEGLQLAGFITIEHGMVAPR